MFIDEARILVISGKGGDGMVHFLREKYKPFGGPDGGDGGRGGDVILAVKPTLNTLAEYQHQHRFKAQDGAAGGRNNRTGRSGEDLILSVPPGRSLMMMRMDARHPWQLATNWSSVKGDAGARQRSLCYFSNQAPRIVHVASQARSAGCV
jgi:Obg family GTPase CgtA